MIEAAHAISQHKWNVQPMNHLTVSVQEDTGEMLRFLKSFAKKRNKEKMVIVLVFSTASPFKM